MKTSLLSVKGRHFDGHSNGSAFSQQYQISDKKDTNSERLLIK